MWQSLGAWDLPAWEKDILSQWEKEKVFSRILALRSEGSRFVFYEGPPSANGEPGIHHVFSRTLKDLYCRYKTQKGFFVPRKAGWDTHGLPVELSVEKELGITKQDIGTKISIAEYNQRCRETVMRYKTAWDTLTTRMGYWVDLDNPYVTFDPAYIESVWFLLSQFYEKGLLYKSFRVQPYSPSAGTALSQHELNLPGCYRPIKDPSVTVLFKVQNTEHTYLAAWTTTPWTLPSNVALAVHPKLRYLKIQTLHPSTHQPIYLILAEPALRRYFAPEGENLPLEPTHVDNKKHLLPYRIKQVYRGNELARWHYHPLFDYIAPEGEKWIVVTDDFVTAEEGTGIVHIAPTFGADDLRVAKQYNLAMPLVSYQGSLSPLVDKEGKFLPHVKDFAGRYVKNYTDDPAYKPVDEDIIQKLRSERKVFRAEKYEHNYPHCWRTDKPILYYPIEAWFVRVSAFRDKLVAHNAHIQWHPASIGIGRFGNWLQSVEDWNLSRSRFWGIPLPIWQNKEGTYTKVIGSFAQLAEEIERSIAHGLMKENPLQQRHTFDPHRPYVDEIILAGPAGEPLYRQPDVIDVWFDSGAMPYAQWHYPFENTQLFKENFPADFIAEGVDQTRGWFYTLHVLATLIFDSVAYKNVVVNGLVLDKEGNKMSKRLGNVINPFTTLEKYGADPTRWYLISNAPAWENIKFDLQGIETLIRRFFHTLHNSYEFFVLYASIDGFDPRASYPVAYTPLDRWILSRLQSLILQVEKAYETYHATLAARAIEEFVVEDLSNWYIRLNRRRFWKNAQDSDKWTAFHVLHTTLKTLAQLMAPIAPFYAEILYQKLHGEAFSVHASDFPKVNPDLHAPAMENEMHYVRKVVSMGHALRKKTGLRVRMPLPQLLLPALYKKWIQNWEPLLKTELNIKKILYVEDYENALILQLRPQYKKLGSVLGSQIPSFAAYLRSLPQKTIATILASNQIMWENHTWPLEEAVEVRVEALPGWLSTTEGNLTIALDTRLTPELQKEGIAREIVHFIQKKRKDLQLHVTDRIQIRYHAEKEIAEAIHAHAAYIQEETLALSLTPHPTPEGNLMEDYSVFIQIEPVYEGVS
ncbi:MAG: isoleucine--tRNA ligase [Bacteroidia bacterium]